MILSLFHPQEVTERRVYPFVSFIKKLLGIKSFQSKVGRHSELSPEESVTYGILKQKQTIKTKKAAYEVFGLESRCSYKTFVVSLNRWAWLAALFISLVLKVNNGWQHPIKHIDSTIIHVCKLKNAKHHKTMQGIAEFGKNGEGWFYGMKLHLIADLLGNFLSLIITPGNVSDKDVNLVAKLAKDIWGILIGDAGYVSEKLSKAINIERIRVLLAKPYKTMKKIATKLQGLLYSTRMLIERHFRCLKEFCGLETNLPRSVRGYFANYFYAIAAYLTV